MKKHEAELVQKLIEALENNTSSLWVDSLECTLECIVTEDVDKVNDCEEEVTEDNFDCEYNGHVLCPSKIPQSNKFTGLDIGKLIEQVKDVLNNDKEYIDEGHTDGIKYYTEQEAIDVIKDILKDDVTLREALEIFNVEDISEDALLDLGWKYYNIFLK